MDVRTAAALLVGAGGAGAATMAALLLADLAGGLASSARVGALAFALLLSIPFALGLQALLRPSSGAPPQARGLVTFAILFWLGGLGGDLFNPGATSAFVTASHAAGALGGVAAAMAGAWVWREPRTRAARRALERRNS